MTCAGCSAVGEQVGELAVNFHARAEPEAAGIFDVAGDAAQHAVFRQPVQAADRDDARLRIFQIRAQMRDAHETEAGDGHVHAAEIFFGRAQFNFPVAAKPVRAP